MIMYRELREALLAVRERPRTLAGGELTPAKRAELLGAPHLAGTIREIREEAERARREPVPPLPFSLFHTYGASGTRKEYERPYFARRGRLLALTLATLLDDTDAYIATLEDLIWHICDEHAWAVPAHLPDSMEALRASRLPLRQIVDLFAAETAHALAETLYLLDGRLNEWVTHRLREEIEQRVFAPVFERSVHFHWASVTNNWAAVCGGAVGMAALLLVDDPERLAGMQDRVASAMDSFLAGYGDDGCCAEGVGYWNYGFGYFVYWAEMLHEYTGGAVDLLNSDKIARIAEFPGAVALSGSRYVNYSDCPPTFAPHTGLGSRLCDRLGVAPPEMTAVPSFHDDHCYRWPHQVRNLLWTKREHMSRTAGDRTFYFPSTDWLVAKRAAPGGLLAFSAKGGHNHEPHNHNDLGHFIVHVGGDTLLADLGAGVYTREYFGSARYSILHNGSAGHSVPVIGGREQAAGFAHRARVLNRERDGDTERFELDLTDAYPSEAGLAFFGRAFRWTCRPGDHAARLVVTDTFEFAEALPEADRTVTEHLISFHKPVIDDGKVFWTGERGSAALAFDPIQLQAEVEELATKDHDTKPETVYRLRLHAGQLPRKFVCELAMDVRLNAE